MDSRLLSDDDLVQITGKTRYSKQVEWFKREFSVDVVRRSTGQIIITWAAFEALQAKRVGLLASLAPEIRPVLHLVREAA